MQVYRPYDKIALAMRNMYLLIRVHEKNIVYTHVHQKLWIYFKIKQRVVCPVSLCKSKRMTTLDCSCEGEFVYEHHKIHYVCFTHDTVIYIHIFYKYLIKTFNTNDRIIFIKTPTHCLRIIKRNGFLKNIVYL